MGDLFYELASSNDDLIQILALQAENLKGRKSAEVEQQEGFVTLQHSFELLKEMNGKNGHVVAKKNGHVIAYALAMNQSFSKNIPQLFPMFNVLSDIQYQGYSLDRLNYIVMGQICVAKEYRGQGVFKELYDRFKSFYADHFDLCITLVACMNERSMAAHKRVGFRTLYRLDNEVDPAWEIVLWDWRQ